DPSLPDMSAIFFAAGPDFTRGTLPQIHNIDIAPTIDKLLGVAPAATVQGAAVDLTPPTITRAGLSTGTLPEGDTLALSGSFSERSTGTPTVTITWGDGSSTPLDLAAGVFTFSAAHPYAQTGTFSIQVVVTDSAGGFDTANLSVDVAPDVTDQVRVQRTG